MGRRLQVCVVKVLASIGALVLVVFLSTEVSMQPRGSERITFLLLFGGAALLTMALARWMPAILRRLTSVRYAIAAPSMIAIGVAAATVLASSWFMFLSSHDLRVFVIALSLGVGLAVALSRALSERLEADMRSLGETARRLSSGDRSVRTGIERPDELGQVAKVLDSTIAQLAASEAAKAEADRARERLLASLSHDLRTPLTAIRMAVEAMQDGVAEDPARYLASIDRDVTAISALVEDLFLLARLESGAVEFEASPVDLVELADEAVEAVAPMAGRAEVQVRVDASDKVTVNGAPHELGRAIRNLLDNALRYSPTGSTVRVVLSNGGTGATLRVIDEGPGFSPGFRPTAFDEFTKGDLARTRTEGGAGLGLAIVRNIVEAHEGQLWIDPEPRGSVAFRLPALVKSERAGG